MPIIKRRLDICGREREWEYIIESAGSRYEVHVRQVGRADPHFECSCGASVEPAEEPPSFFSAFQQPCPHIAEAQRDLQIARQAAAQMIP